MKTIHALFTTLHAAMALLFALVSLSLLWIAVMKGWSTLVHGLDGDATLHMVEAMGVLAAAMVALQISQTVVEEEVMREASISGPTRVRRFLSRFLVVVVVALAIEALIATFKGQEHPSNLFYSAALMAGVGLMLMGWGLFVHFNRSAEELEPEALKEATQEDMALTCGPVPQAPASAQEGAPVSTPTPVPLAVSAAVAGPAAPPTSGP